MAGQTVEWNDVQGLVLRGYEVLRYGCYFVLQIADVSQAKSWISGLVLTPATESPKDEATHLALTAIGLTNLGVDSDQLKTFSIPFQQGLVTEHRSRILGDVGPNAPTLWEWGGNSEETLDILLMLFDADAIRLSERAALICESITGCRVVRKLDARIPDDGRDHFGFVDGISQPKIEEAPKADGSSDVAVGEFVLGYRDGRGELQPVPTLNPFDCQDGAIGKNGTYIVLRQLEQHVDEFHRWLLRNGESDDEREFVAAKIIGRWRDGHPLVDVVPSSEIQTSDPYFDFTGDRLGLRCPLGSHVRRANPRDDLRDSDASDVASANLSKKIVSHHRIIRRGRIFGPLWRPTAQQPLPDASVRGLYFMCLNASISNQFEFIQQAWVNNPSFRGLYDEVDPLVGVPHDGKRDFTVQQQPVRRRYTGLPRFTTVRGGAYFFMPGLRAIKGLVT